MNARIGPAERKQGSSARPPLVRELLLVVGLFLVYKIGRQLADGRTGEAFGNARHVWDFERAVHLPSETAVQGALLHSDTLVHVANTYYATVHFPATVLFLAWLYWRRPVHYVWSRRVLTALTGAALVLHLTVPLAPPRMLASTGLIDTGRVFGPSVYGASPASDQLSNQYAAMPSLHVGWALMVAVGLIVATRSRWRWLWLLHPLLTLFVVVSTANHYWLDAIVAVALLGVALAFIRLPRRGSLIVRSSKDAVVASAPDATEVRGEPEAKVRSEAEVHVRGDSEPADPEPRSPSSAPDRTVPLVSSGGTR
ncbi:phosphatase PAP2 family protein [Streptomyces liangshanensis]|uniref:Inositol phosphorylceramide synthase n=1 Tax=Streptomyces liangshanensis TaxID=2717324 RepID=A0A6G9GU14_9ACTN|nr:phosphatase PAP2 family protein [Streptomyces liangshanensis]QIQ01694.1 inositol phosphorylceramide synthase [Streptomyces liangshanensis]